MKRVHLIVAAVARVRRLPARAVRRLGGRAAGRGLPAGTLRGHGPRPDRSGRQLLHRDRRDDHARPDLP